MPSLTIGPLTYVIAPQAIKPREVRAGKDGDTWAFDAAPLLVRCPRAALHRMCVYLEFNASYELTPEDLARLPAKPGRAARQVGSSSMLPGHAQATAWSGNSRPPSSYCLAAWGLPQVVSKTSQGGEGDDLGGVGRAPAAHLGMKESNRPEHVPHVPPVTGKTCSSHAAMNELPSGGRDLCGLGAGGAPGTAAAAGRGASWQDSERTTARGAAGPAAAAAAGDGACRAGSPGEGGRSWEAWPGLPPALC